MFEFLLIVSLCIVAVTSILAVMIRSMLKSAISLAAASVFLAIVIFMMGAHWAAVVELSVCAGLITVVFVSAISLTTTERRGEENSEEHRRRYAFLPFLLIFMGIGLITVLALNNFQINIGDIIPASFKEFGDAFWQTRQVDILGQIIVILTGTFAVVVLFKGKDEE